MSFGLEYDTSILYGVKNDPEILYCCSVWKLDQTCGVHFSYRNIHTSSKTEEISYGVYLQLSGMTLRIKGEKQLGLPNPGVKVGLHRHHREEVLSIAEVIKGDFRKLVEIIPEGTNIELNLSCPNLGKSLPWDSAECLRKRLPENGALQNFHP